jgi:hypothetical protein
MNKNIKLSSNRSFGLVFFFVFLIISLFPLLSGNNIRVWLLTISFIFLLLGLKNSKILLPLNKIWFRFGIFLGNFISPIVMGVIFFIVITPISLLLRILGKDVLNLNKNNKKTYWIKRDTKKSEMKNQF